MRSRGNLAQCALACLVGAFGFQARGQVSAVFPIDDRSLTRDYLKFRFRAGALQNDWIEVLYLEPTELNAGSKREVHSSRLQARLAAEWGVESSRELENWVAENYPLIQKITSLPPPAGPEPLHDAYSLSEYGVNRTQSAGEMRKKLKLLIAGAIMAKENEARKRYFNAIENMSRIAVAGCGLIEISGGCFINSYEWTILLRGLFDDPDSYRPIVLAAPDVVKMTDLATTVKECHRRYILSVAADSNNGGLVEKSLDEKELETLDHIYLDLSRLIESMRSRSEIVAFQDKITDPTLKQVIGEELKGHGLARTAERILYLEDLRIVTRAIAKSGLEGAVTAKTKFFRLELNKNVLLARKGDRTVQLWPPGEELGNGFEKLVHP